MLVWFIYNLFGVWSGTPDALQSLVAAFNSKLNGIQLKREYTKFNLSFLDTLVSISGTKLVTDLYLQTYWHHQLFDV